MFPTTRYGRLTLFCVLLEAICVIALESVVAGIFISETDQNNNAMKSIPVYLIIFIFSQLFQIALVWDALLNKNTIQIIGFVVFNLCIFAYSIFQYYQMRDLAFKDLVISEDLFNRINTPLWLISAITGAFEVIFCFFSFKLYLEFGWKIYKKIGADPKMRNMYRWYQIFLMLLKLDVFFFLAFSSQFLYLVLDKNDPEFALTIAALPVTIIIVSLAVYGLRREDKWIMVVFMFGLLLAIAYFAFKLARMHQRSISPDKYAASRRYLTFFGSLTLMLVIMTMVNSVICYRNFGKGLKQHLSNNQASLSESTSPAPLRRPLED